MDKEFIEEVKKLEQEQKDLKEEESIVFRKLKRVYIVAIALILLALLLVNTQTGYHLINLASGNLVSSTLDENYSFDLKQGGKVYFEQSLWNVLEQYYKDNQKAEFKLCITGQKQGMDFYTESIYQPYIYSQDVFSVTATPCNSSTIISLHSHPPLHCVFSEQDMRAYETFRQISPDGIVALMCGDQKLTFYQAG